MKTRLQRDQKRPGAKAASSYQRKESSSAAQVDQRSASVRQERLMPGIDSSPMMTLQRKQLERLTGDLVQRVEEDEEELMQAKVGVEPQDKSRKLDLRPGSRLEAWEKGLAGSAPVQRKKLDFKTTRDYAYQCLRAWVSPESGFVRKKGLRALVDVTLERKRIPYDDEDVESIVEFVNGYEEEISMIAPTEFDKFVDALGAYGGRGEYVAYLKSIKWKDNPPPSNKPPAVVFGRAVTTAFYDSAKHVITLDPWKLGSWSEHLDALTFECQNALQRKELRAALREEGGTATAAVEYESDKKYVDAIKGINKASTLDQLVKKLGIDKRFLVPANHAACVKTGKVDRPDRSVMPEQDKRQALWWWKTKNWSDDQRKQIWMMENHGVGVGSSIEIYGQ